MIGRRGHEDPQDADSQDLDPQDEGRPEQLDTAEALAAVRRALEVRHESEERLAQALAARREIQDEAQLLEQARTVAAQLVVDAESAAELTTEQARERATGILANARAEADDLVAEARADAEHTRAEVKQEAAQVRETARREAVAEVSRDLGRLRETLAALSGGVADGVGDLRESLERAEAAVMAVTRSLDDFGAWVGASHSADERAAAEGVDPAPDTAPITLAEPGTATSLDDGVGVVASGEDPADPEQPGEPDETADPEHADVGTSDDESSEEQPSDARPLGWLFRSP